MKDSMLMNPALAVELFHVVADPARLQILDERKDDERRVCELTDWFESGQ